MRYATHIWLTRSDDFVGQGGGTPIYNVQVFETGDKGNWKSPAFSRQSVRSAKRLAKRLVRDHERILAT